MDQPTKVAAVTNPQKSRSTTTSYGAEIHMQWLDTGSVGSESADEQQLGEDFDDESSELSSTPLAKSVT